MKPIRFCFLAIGVFALAACTSPPVPGHKLVLQTIQRANRPPVYLYREVPDDGSH